MCYAGSFVGVDGIFIYRIRRLSREYSNDEAGRVVDALRKVIKIRIVDICGFASVFSFFSIQKNSLAFKNLELVRVKSY